MNHLAVVLGFFAAPPEEQVAAMPSLPLDTGVPTFHSEFGKNPLLILAQSYLRFFHHRDDEPWDAFLERLGVPSATDGWPSAAGELSYVLGTVQVIDQPLWTRKALDRKVEWRVVRRLAGETLREFGWAERTSVDALNAVLATYTPLVETEWREEGWTWLPHPPRGATG